MMLIPSRSPIVLLLLLTLYFTKSSSFCPQYCGCNDTSLSVQCHSSSNLRVVPIFLNPQIKSLSLSHNQIKDITLSLQFYQELVHLDISANQLLSLGKGNFESLRALETLNVSYNQVKVLESGAFQGLGTLTRLDLSGNQVERVERDIFASLRHIQEIVLDRNRLEFIDWDLFRGLEKLTRISVQYNFIQVIEPSPILSPGGSSTTPGSTLPLLLPPWTLNVQILDVSSNQLTRVKDNSLRVFTSLKELNLCCNYIHTLEDRAFTSLPALERVNLSQNRLGRVPSTPLSAVATSLRSLDLSSNRLSNSIPSTAFHSLHNLQFLLLNDNPALESLHPDSLSEQINLLSLEADYLPNLTEFSGSLLTNKPYLQRFSLRYAHIGMVPSNLVEDIRDPAARALDISGNPIDCNCSAFQLFQYLQHYTQTEGGGDEEGDVAILPPESNFLLGSNLSHAHQPYVDQSGRKNKGKGKKSPFYLSTVRCSSPPNLSGILVKDLKGSDFSECFTSEDHFQMLVIIIAASILSLIFLIVGVKLCCFSSLSGIGRCEGRKWCGCCWSSCKGRRKAAGGTFCKTSCPCFGGGEKELNLDKADHRLFDGFRGRDGQIGGGQMMQQHPQERNHFIGVQVQQSPSGKLFFAADNSSPSHQPHPHIPQQSYYTPNGNSLPFAEEGSYHPVQSHHTLRQHHHHPTMTNSSSKSNQPLPPLPPYNYNNFTFNPKPTKSFQNNFLTSDGGNEYTSPHDLQLQHRHQHMSHYDYDDDDEEDDDDDNNDHHRHHHHNQHHHHTHHNKYNNGSSAGPNSSKSRKSSSSKHNTLRENGHFGGSSSSFSRVDRQVPSVLV